MHTDAIDRFWDRYIEKATQYNVPIKSIKWYIQHTESYIKAYPSLRLAQHSLS